MSQQTRQQIRKLIRHTRRELSEAFQQLASQQLLVTLSKHTTFQHATSIALYLANDGELDLSPLISWCWQNKKSVYLPIIHPFSVNHLLFTEYKPRQKMTKNKFGISEPVLNVTEIISAQALDIICTPLVAFDETGARLGMGGGFYDRTLATFERRENKQKKMPYIVGLAHDCQQIDKVPTELWDIPIPEIITPSRRIVC